MAKSKRTVTQTSISDRRGIGQQVQHSEVFDDSLLPDASEIAKLQRLDPNVVDWLKERATKEQEFRHNAYNTRLDIIKRTENSLNSRNTLGLIFAFLIIAGGGTASYFLLMADHAIAGSIFGGFSLFSGAGLFIDQSKKKEPNKGGEGSD